MCVSVHLTCVFYAAGRFSGCFIATFPLFKPYFMHLFNITVCSYAKQGAASTLKQGKNRSKKFMTFYLQHDIQTVTIRI